MRTSYLDYWIMINLMICVKGMGNVDYKYFSTGDDITLKCDCKAIYWNGPTLENTDMKISQVEYTDIYDEFKVWNVSIYTNGDSVASTLPQTLLSRLQVIGNNPDLHITNLSHSDEGLYTCDSGCGEFGNRFLLQIKTLPTNLVILNVDNNYTVKGIEDVPLDLICLVESGKPPEVLRWLKDGISIMEGGPSKLVYSFVPDTNDLKSVYSCEVRNSFMEMPLKMTINLDIQYKPSIKINVSDTLIDEGKAANLCCSSRSNPKPLSVMWFKEDKKLVSSNSESAVCYMMNNVSRHDTGNYTCYSMNKIGNASSEIMFVISFAPVVTVRYSKFNDDSMVGVIECKAEGEPNSYSYYPWEHRSLLNEHIRYLGTTDNGILQLPFTNISNIYQDAGFYICNVTNGVPDYNGNVFQQGRAYIESKGPPVFAANNERSQGKANEPAAEVKVYVYSSSAINCHNITRIGSVLASTMDIDVKTNLILLKEKYYDANITVNGTEIIFILNGLNFHGSRQFNITVCNSYGQSSFVVELKSAASRKNSKRTTIPTAIIVTTVILTLIFLPLLLKCFVIVKDNIKNETVDEESEAIEGQSESVANRLYNSVPERDMGFSQTLQDELRDDGSLTVTNARLYDNPEITTAMESQLNYADVIFQPSSSGNEVQIIGLEDRIHYADVDVSARTTVIQSDDRRVGIESIVGSDRSSSEDDFVDVGGITNYMQNRSINI